MGHRGEVGFAKIFARSPATVERKSRSSRAIASGRAPENAGKTIAAPSRAGDRVIGIVLVEGSDFADCHIEKRNLGFENIPEKTGYPQRDVDARSFKFCKRQDFDACNTI